MAPGVNLVTHPLDLVLEVQGIQQVHGPHGDERVANDQGDASPHASQRHCSSTSRSKIKTFFAARCALNLSRVQGTGPMPLYFCERKGDQAGSGSCRIAR